MKMPYLTLSIDDEQDLKLELERKQDEFLDVYSLYLQTRVAWIREEVKLKAYELRLLDPGFSFQLN